MMLAIQCPEDSVFMVQYNDCYGNGNKSIEGYVNSPEEFEAWLKKRNEERAQHGECEEHKEEFDLIELTKLISPNV